MLYFYFQIVKICLNYLCYDPNYNYDDDDGDDSMDTERIDDDEGYDFFHTVIIYQVRYLFHMILMC